MWLRAALMIPLMATIPTLTDDGCGGGEPTDPPPDNDFAAFEAMLEDVDAAGSTSAKQAVVNDFVRHIAYSGGFPIVEGDTVTFVFQTDMAGPIRVAGDFNGWDANQHVLSQTDGFPLYYATLTLDDVGARSLYKFIGRAGGQDSYVADPNARRYQFDSFGEYSLIAGGPEASHLERYPAFESDALSNTRDLALYIPAGYEESQAAYPTLFMHDGQNLFDPEAFWGGWQADDVADDLIASGQIDPVILVGMANTPGRMDEYTHVEDFIPSAGGWVGGEGEAYTTFVVDEVLPFIEDRYRMSGDPADTGVLGSSLGGLISYYIGFRHSEIFGYVGGMSSTFGWGKIGANNDTVIDIMAVTQKRSQTMYLDSGGGVVGSCEGDADGDGIWDDNPSAGDNYCETLQMKTVLEAQGYQLGDDLIYVHAQGAEHNEAAWHERMDEALEAFVGR